MNKKLSLKEEKKYELEALKNIKSIIEVSLSFDMLCKETLKFSQLTFSHSMIWSWKSVHILSQHLAKDDSFDNEMIKFSDLLNMWIRKNIFFSLCAKWKKSKRSKSRAWFHFEVHMKFNLELFGCCVTNFWYNKFYFNFCYTISNQLLW